MKKKIKKEFNVKDAQNGALIETVDGQQVRIICYDKFGTDYPIIALVKYNNVEHCLSYDINGKYANYEDNNEDLIIIDEIESKFNEGDYIVGEAGIVYKITNIDYMYHTTQVSSGYRQRWTIEDVESNFHKWTIKDAKVGDILTIIENKKSFIFKGCLDKDHPNYPIAFCGIDCSNEFAISKGDYWWTNGDIRPATDIEEILFYNILEEEGYKWNSDTLTLSKNERRRGNQNVNVSGYFIDNDSKIEYLSSLCRNIPINHNVFSTEKQAKSALAMARISQIMANDERFGGIVTDNEWDSAVPYFVIAKVHNMLIITRSHRYEYLGFHTIEQAKLFLEENEDLVKDYYMLD